MKNVIFIHAAILDRCKERILQYLNIIKTSLLLDNVICIYICFVGDAEVPLNERDIIEYNYKKNIFIIKTNSSLDEYEIPTLQLLYTFCCRNPNYNVLYLHTKNVGKVVNICIEDQIVYMLHFLVTKWEECINKLVKNDTCGVDLRLLPTLHYSGNFWWSTSENICLLPSPIQYNNLITYPNPLQSLRHNQEFWVCHIKTNRHFCLWDCGINVYERHIHPYPKCKYLGCDAI